MKTLAQHHPLMSIMVAMKLCKGYCTNEQYKINCPTVFPLRQCFIGPFLSAESWLPVSERGSKWMAPLMHFILRGVREGGMEGKKQMKEWSWGKENRNDRGDRLVENEGHRGGIKAVFVFHH